ARTAAILTELRMERSFVECLSSSRRAYGSSTTCRSDSALVPTSTTAPYNIAMPLIEPGQKAPNFSLNDQHGKAHKLSEYAGRPLLLYFYPKDDTPGCTKESCAFQDNLPKFKSSKAAVLGVSILDEASKARFADKYKLTFPLL